MAGIAAIALAQRVRLHCRRVRTADIDQTVASGLREQLTNLAGDACQLCGGWVLAGGRGAEIFKLEIEYRELDWRLHYAQRWRRCGRICRKRPQQGGGCKEDAPITMILYQVSESLHGT
jgi:hypothetical protein